MMQLAIAAYLIAAHHHDTVGSYGWERFTRAEWWNGRPYLPTWLAPYRGVLEANAAACAARMRVRATNEERLYYLLGGH